MDGQQTGDAGAFGVLAANKMAGALGRDHKDVKIGGGTDLAEVDVEPVGKSQGGAGSEMGAICSR